MEPRTVIDVLAQLALLLRNKELQEVVDLSVCAVHALGGRVLDIQVHFKGLLHCLSARNIFVACTKAGAILGRGIEVYSKMI